LFAYRFTYPLVEYRPRPEWHVQDVVHIPGHEFPHLCVTIAHDLLGNDQCLLRGELLAIIRIMIDRLESDDFREHRKAPILLFSFAGPLHSRILHAYYDDGLVISYTRLYDFTQVNIPDLQLLMRWAMANPVGNTRI
ncbi:hypothetical protein DH86_00003617, partial [Scytalidium sp. 3C]